MSWKYKHPDAAHEATEFGRRMLDVLGQAADMQPVPVGASARELVHEDGGVRLYRYAATQARTQGTPLLIVYSLVNRPYILDLKPERSMIRSLLDAGVDVYLLDWGEPEPMDRLTTLDDYINGHLARNVEWIGRQHRRKAINLLGVCQGGTLSLCYAALHPERVASLVTLVTPVDFHTEGNVLWHLSKHIDVDAVVDAFGNVSADLLNQVFVSLKPFRLLSQRYLDMSQLAGQPDALADFLRMEQWMYDSPDQAGEAFRQFAQDFYQHNRLVEGGVQLGEQRVELSRIKAPIFNVYATSDHLVPEASARALEGCVGSRDYTEVPFAGGHLGVFISGRAHRDLYPRIADWLDAQAKKRSRTRS